MSSRRALAALAVSCTAVLAAPVPSALAKTPHGKSAVRKQLLRDVKRNPSIVRKRSFLKRAALVNFKLPVTIRLRTGSNPALNNPNRATIDLGPSLGRREVEIGGTLAAEITFRDSFDGGALGNVDIAILPSPDSSAFGLETTSVPLLWNDQANSGSWAPGSPTPGCGDFTGNAGIGVPYFGTAPWNANGYNATAGAPLFSPSGAAAYQAYLNGTGPLPTAAAALDGSTPYTPVVPGVDGLDRLAVSKAPGADALGGNAQPFPYSASSVPGGFSQPPDVRNTVLRTGPLRLQIAQPGIEIDWAHPPDGAGQGSQNYVTQKSGGQANLFGNIP